MAIRECGRGHVYDTDQYAACPYCNSGRSTINFVAGNVEGRTTTPSGYNATVAPDMQGGARSWSTGASSSFMGDENTRPPYGTSEEEPSKTVAPESYRRKMEEKGKTVGVFKKKYDLEPVVGWLVCIEGSSKGKDYHLWAKRNSIGRSEKSDVCLQDDMTISRENHAWLAYDHRHNTFRIIPGDSTNNIYLNDEPI